MRNEVRPLIASLDSLPFPDRLLYRRHPDIAFDPVQPVLTGRGCPFDCSFCFNHSLKEIYRGKGAYVRRRSPENVIAELEGLLEPGTVKRIYFVDDAFSSDHAWLERFLELYRASVSLPFHCLVRIDQIDDPTASLLARSGCKAVFFGIESGDEDIRNRIIGKRLPEPRIREGVRALHRQGIPFRTYNMVGLPGESIDQALRTVRLNIDLKTPFPWCSLFSPYPGTRLAQFAADNGMCEPAGMLGRRFASFHDRSRISGRDMREHENLHKLFQTAVLFPVLLPLIRVLIKLPPNPLFRLWFTLVYGMLYLRSEGRGLFRTVRSALRNARFLPGGAK